MKRTMNQMPSVEVFLARHSQLDDGQKAVLEALIMAQARGVGTPQAGSGGRVEGFLARYSQLDDEQKAVLRTFTMAQAAAPRQEIAEARPQWREETAARPQSVRRTRVQPPQRSIHRSLSAAADILDHYAVESGEDSGAIPSWKAETRELMAQIRRETAARRAGTARDRAARRAEVQELMGAHRQWFAEAKAQWREEAEDRREEVQRFMEELRRERQH